jgi:hypothetical protein
LQRFHLEHQLDFVFQSRLRRDDRKLHGKMKLESADHERIAHEGVQRVKRVRLMKIVEGYIL